jgi:hypothetical protein
VRGTARRIVVALAAGSAAVALSGCVAISSTSTGQPESMGPVSLAIGACVTGSPGCSAESNTGSIYELIAGESIQAQVLVGVRLPVGSTPPENLLASLSGGGTLAFSRSPSYEAELQALEPAPSGERWWGWISVATTYSHAKSQSFTVGLTATLPRPPDTGPLESPMHWRPVVGSRLVEAGLPASRSVKCGGTNEDLYEGFDETGASTPTIVCVDSPSPAATRGFLTAPLTDFGILGSNVQTPPGGTVTAAFVARRSGAADPTTTLSLAAQSGIPGGTVAIDRTTVSLGGDATQPVLATIGVPAGTPAGTYLVSLTASAPGKPDRMGTASVTVTVKPLAIRSASLTRKRFRTTVKRAKSGQSGPPVGTKLKVDLSDAAILSIEVFSLGAKGPKLLGTPRKSLPSGPTAIAIRKRIGAIKLKPGRYRLDLIARGDAGQVSDPKQLRFTVVGG